MWTTWWTHCCNKGDFYCCFLKAIKCSSAKNFLLKTTSQQLLLLRTHGQFHFTQKLLRNASDCQFVYRSAVECAIALPLLLLIDNFPIGRMHQHFYVKHKPLHCDSITTAFFFHSAIMTGASCLKSMWLIASIQLYELCWHLKSLSMDQWKSRTWCVLILSVCTALCVVFGIFVFCLHSPRGKRKGRNFRKQFHNLGLVEMTVKDPPWSPRKEIV